MQYVIQHTNALMKFKHAHSSFLRLDVYPHTCTHRLNTWQNWRVNEGLPQCPTALSNITLLTTYSDNNSGGRSQTARLFATWTSSCNTYMNCMRNIDKNLLICMILYFTWKSENHGRCTKCVLMTRNVFNGGTEVDIIYLRLISLSLSMIYEYRLNYVIFLRHLF